MDASEWLWRLRGDHPAWGIFHDPFHHRWVGVRGKIEFLMSDSAIGLDSKIRAQVYRPEYVAKVFY